MNYEDLSLKEKASVIRAAVKNGITNLKDIKNKWNWYLTELNNYDYDASRYANENIEEAISHKEGSHFTDKYKKPNHPTFSTESIYSNALTTGGKWGYLNGLYTFEPSDYLIDTYGANHIIEGLKNQGDSNVTPIYKGGRLLPEVNIHSSKKYDIGGIIDTIKGWLKGDTTPEEPVILEPAPLNLKELAVRQAYAESTLDPTSSNDLKATGLFQIRPIALKDYNTKTGKSYTILDMLDADKNIEVRNYLMNDLLQRAWNTKNNPSDSILYAKSLAAFNYGASNLVSLLNKAKSEGVDIYNSWDWLPYLELETQDYVNFILRNQDNSILRNQAAYDSISALKPDIVKKVLGSIKSTGGPLYPFSFNKQIPSVRY